MPSHESVYHCRSGESDTSFLKHSRTAYLGGVNGDPTTGERRRVGERREGKRSNAEDLGEHLSEANESDENREE